MSAGILFSLLLLAGNSGVSPSPHSPPPPRRLDLTLEDCLRQALLYAPDLERARHLALAAGERIGEAEGAFEPVLSASGTWAHDETPASSALQGAVVPEETTINATGGLQQPLQTGGSVGLNYSYARQRTNSGFFFLNPSTFETLELSLTQPLLRGAWTPVAREGIRRAEINRDRAGDDLDETEIQLLYDVTAAYWDLVFTGEDRNVKRLSLERAERLLEINRRRVDVGAAPPVEVLQAEADIAMRREDLITAENAIREAEDRLKMLVFPFRGGDEWDVEIVPSSAPPAAGPESVEDWRATLDVALAHRPDVARARADVLDRELSLHRAENDLLPRLDLVGSLASKALRGEVVPQNPGDPRGTIDEGSITSGEFPTGSVGLVFEFPLGNMAARAKRRGAVEDLYAARVALRGLENAVAREARDAVREIRFLRERIEASGKSRELASRQLAAEEIKFEQGASTNFEVLQLQEDLAEALSNENRAVLDHAKALANLRRVQGLPLL